MKNFHFKGILSGDHESFCWDVDKDTFKNITGREPTEDDESYFHGNTLFRLYPNMLFKNHINNNAIQEFEISITNLNEKNEHTDKNI